MTKVATCRAQYVQLTLHKDAVHTTLSGTTALAAAHPLTSAHNAACRHLVVSFKNCKAALVHFAPHALHPMLSS
jgi:hypothetical protein